MQTIVTHRQIRQLTSVCLAIYCLLTGLVEAKSTDPLHQIRLAVKNYAQKTLAVDDVKIGHLDKRLRLSTCSSALRVFVPKGAMQVGKSTMGVQCNDTPGWKIYIPVELNRFALVVVSEQTLPRDTIIGPNDITMRKMDLGQLRNGYFKSVDEVIGMQLKRPLQGGQSLSPANLKPRRMVQRGDIITILAEVQGLTVRVKGHALTDGYRGESIRVENQRSKRILQAEVVAPGIVRVRL